MIGLTTLPVSRAMASCRTLSQRHYTSYTPTFQVGTISLRMGAPAEIDTAHIKSTALKDLLDLLEGVCNPTSAVRPSH